MPCDLHVYLKKPSKHPHLHLRWFSPLQKENHQILSFIRSFRFTVPFVEKGLQILHGKGMVEGMSNSSLDFDFCENFVYGQQNWVSFPFGGKRVKQILELSHSDVFGPVKVPSLGKSMYYVSFIDDFSRNTWIYFLEKKSEVFDKF